MPGMMFVIGGCALHLGTVSGILSRRIRSRIARKRRRGMETFAIWKTACCEWATTF
jgi:hypothetical protein